MSNKICVVTGVGPGTGKAIAERFARGGYTVAMLARDAGRLEEISKRTENTVGFVCDVADEMAIGETLAKVEHDLGQVSCLIHNAVGGALGNFLEVGPEVLEQNFRINTCPSSDKLRHACCFA